MPGPIIILFKGYLLLYFYIIFKGLQSFGFVRHSVSNANIITTS